MSEAAAELDAEITSKVESLPRRDTASVRALRREFSRRLGGVDPEMVIDLAFCLIARPEFLYRFVAYELIRHHRGAFALLDEALVERLGQGVDSWYDVDTFGLEISGQVWREGRVSDDAVARWASSDDRWWRRLALVSTVPLNLKTRGGSGEPLRTLALCELLLDDRDDTVVKAMSWALRVLSERDRAAVERFVDTYREWLAPRVLREVRNKLTTGLKNPSRR